MSAPSSRASGALGPGTWLLLVLFLLLAGAGMATWVLARNDGAARFFGVAPRAETASTSPLPPPNTVAAQPLAAPEPEPAQLAAVEQRLARLETETRQAAGSAGRADALLVAFAARRAIDRGVALGYLEPLLIDRFGPTHRQAVATIITAGRRPVSLEQLTAEFDSLGSQLQQRGPDESLWQGFQRELGSLVSIRRADRPNPRPSATFERARTRLAAGKVDLALAEAMRLPGIAQAQPWVARARAYVAAQRALDEVESAALLGPSP